MKLNLNRKVNPPHIPAKARDTRLLQPRNSNPGGSAPLAFLITSFALSLGMSVPALAQSQPVVQSPAPGGAASASIPQKPDTPGNGQEKAESGATPEMEAKFVTDMTNVTFQGRWCLIKDGVLGPEKPEKYEIVSVVKSGGDRWVINARIQYGAINLVVPVPVKMKWAGDTPVIIVDKFGLPGAGTYSARVLIYEGTYAGTWTGGDHGGLLNGLIARTPAPAETK
jgi:hypothetical protein